MSAPKLSGCIRLSEASMAPVVVELSTYSVTSSSYDYFLPSFLYTFFSMLSPLFFKKNKSSVKTKALRNARLENSIVTCALIQSKLMM